MAKSKGIKGTKYVSADEKYDKKTLKKDQKSMKVAGIANALKKSQKEEGYSNKPKVKPQKKNAKPVSGQKKVC